MTEWLPKKLWNIAGCMKTLSVNMTFRLGWGNIGCRGEDGNWRSMRSRRLIGWGWWDQQSIRHLPRSRHRVNLPFLQLTIGRIIAIRNSTDRYRIRSISILLSIAWLLAITSSIHALLARRVLEGMVCSFYVFRCCPGFLFDQPDWISCNHPMISYFFLISACFSFFLRFFCSLQTFNSHLALLICFLYALRIHAHLPMGTHV